MRFASASAVSVGSSSPSLFSSSTVTSAEVFTSSDVTVEELRGAGEEPRLTAEALAERIGEALSPDEDA